MCFGSKGCHLIQIWGRNTADDQLVTNGTIISQNAYINTYVYYIDIVIALFVHVSYFNFQFSSLIQRNILGYINIYCYVDCVCGNIKSSLGVPNWQVQNLQRLRSRSQNSSKLSTYTIPRTEKCISVANNKCIAIPQKNGEEKRNISFVWLSIVRLWLTLGVCTWEHMQRMHAPFMLTSFQKLSVQLKMWIKTWVRASWGTIGVCYSPWYHQNIRTVRSSESQDTCESSKTHKS